MENMEREMSIVEEFGDTARNSSAEAGPSQIHNRSSFSFRNEEHSKKIGHRRVIDGQVTYKKKPTSELMMAIQLGIGQSITSVKTKPHRDVLLHDFSIVETILFPREGSNLTPAHRYSDFRFKTYAPVAFRYFRDLFGIKPDDFLLSMCNDAMKELSNPGASGSIFYITSDDEFIIKTVQHKEAEFLQKLLPGYYMNLNQNKRTLLPKFYGLYCYQCGGKNIRFVVMNNLVPSIITMHQKYDLKGSTYGRKASKSERAKAHPTYKDLDFREHYPEGIMIESGTYNALMKTMERDCRVLESFKIMDYSLLFGIHHLDQHYETSHEILGQLDDITNASALARGRSIKQKIASYSTTMEAIHSTAEPVEIENEDIPPGGIPARNHKGDRLLLYMGIIDILQSYRFAKKLEHTFKSMLHDGDSISVHRPGFYAERFRHFFDRLVFRKIPALDPPHLESKKRFRKIVQLAMKSSPIRYDLKKTASADENNAPDMKPDLLQTSSLGTPMKLRITALSSSRSPAHSIADSTATHTEHTEGSPSYTTSSPSLSHDTLADSTSRIATSSHRNDENSASTYVKAPVEVTRL